MAEEGGDSPYDLTGGGMGIYIRAQATYEGGENIAQAIADTDKLQTAQKEEMKVANAAGKETLKAGSGYRMLAMSAMSAVTGLAMAAGANKEVIQVLQAVNAILSVAIMMWTVYNIVSGGSAFMAGGAGRALGKAMSGIGRSARIDHHGGYGQDQLAMINSNERVVPSYRIMTNYGGNISIGNLVIQGGTGDALARDFTEQLESYKQRNAVSPEWS